MTSKNIRREIMERAFGRQIDGHVQYLVGRLEEVVEKGSLPLWHHGDHEWDTTVDEMQRLGWVETYDRKGETFYRPTNKGKELYQQMKQTSRHEA